MTYGSTYGMRVDNTVGYFALSGEHNHSLVEKSDREGFVEDSAYRGFMQIALQCRKFANESLEQVRRAHDDYYKRLNTSGVLLIPPTVGESFRVLESEFKSAEDARLEAERVTRKLQVDIEQFEHEAEVGGASGTSTARALEVANNAVTAIETVRVKIIQ